MFQVLRISGFIAFLTLAFLNAFVDLGHKIIIQNTIFKTYDGEMQIILTAIVNALILLPFILVFSPAGFLADKYPKPHIMRISAWVAVALTLLITLSYYQGWFWFGFSMTFLLALQSAFYSPAKYGYIKELIGVQKLSQGNALVQSTTMISILLGIFFFSILFETLLGQWLNATPQAILNDSTILMSVAPLGWVLVGLTLLEVYCAYRIYPTQTKQSDMNFNWQTYFNGQSSINDIKVIWNTPIIWFSIIGLSSFWALCQVILATYPSFLEDNLAVENTIIVQGLMACSGIGIMIGSLLAGYLSRSHIETALIPIGAIGLCLTTTFIIWLDNLWLQGINFIVLGIMGGVFVVPLNALIQYHADNTQLGRILASNNLMQNMAMLLFLVGTILLTSLGLGSIGLLSILAIIATIGTAYTVYYLPKALVYFIGKSLFQIHYRLKPIGSENIPATGGVLLLGNHISWIDWALLQMASPRPLRFVIDKDFYQRWYSKWLLDLFGAIPIRGAASGESLKKITAVLQAGEVVCLFPEGALSRNGQLGEFKQGYEKTLSGAPETVIIPFYLCGLWGSRFSRIDPFARANRQFGFKRNVVVAFGKPLAATTTAVELKQQVFATSVQAWQNYAAFIPPIPYQWLRVAKRHLFRLATADIQGMPLNHQRFIVAVVRFRALIAARNPAQNVGILLPTSGGSAITNMAAMTLGKTVVNLNFTASAAALQSAAQQTQLGCIFTSKRFVEKLKERNIDIATIYPDLELIYLEDLRASIPKAHMLSTLVLITLLPSRLLQWLYIKPLSADATAAILFSSGSEGIPKGVELSHRNISVNARQVADVLNPRKEDALMATLPTFHAFGLLATTMMPLSEGIPIICHPDPTDGVNIAKGVARYKATILFGTATFLRLYARSPRIHPTMLQSLRVVVAGAEKLTPEIRRIFTERFGKTIYEGYGATETSPVASVNLPDEIDTDYWHIQFSSRVGSVGLALPGSSFRIVDPDTLLPLPRGQAGLILIGGPQIMKGYLHNPEKTQAAIVEMDGIRWYKTGDKGHVDVDGFLTIVDRYSRFAKLGGEMISLTSVELQIREIMEDPDMDIVAVNLPDSKKGEKIVVLLSGDYDTSTIRPTLLAKQMNALMIPAQYYLVDAIPKLGSGKTDFPTARQVALAKDHAIE